MDFAFFFFSFLLFFFSFFFFFFLLLSVDRVRHCQIHMPLAVRSRKKERRRSRRRRRKSPLHLGMVLSPPPHARCPPPPPPPFPPSRMRFSSPTSSLLLLLLLACLSPCGRMRTAEQLPDVCSADSSRLCRRKQVQRHYMPHCHVLYVCRAPATHPPRISSSPPPSLSLSLGRSAGLSASFPPHRRDKNDNDGSALPPAPPPLCQQLRTYE